MNSSKMILLFRVNYSRFDSEVLPKITRQSDFYMFFW